MSCRPFARFILFTFNFLLFVAGILLLAFGIVAVADAKKLSGLIQDIPGVENASTVIDIPELVVNSAVFMIVVGSILLIFGFLGCVGGWCMAKWMLFLYWVLLVLLLLAEVALLIFAAVSPSKAEEQIKINLDKSLKNKFKPVIINGSDITLPSELVAAAWVAMQFEVGCCGSQNYTDFSHFDWNRTFVINNKNVTAFVPPSCCQLKNDKNVPKNLDPFTNLEGCLNGFTTYINTEGCYPNVKKLVVKYSYIPIAMAAIAIGIEIILIAVAIYLWRSNDKKKQLV